MILKTPNRKYLKVDGRAIKGLGKKSYTYLRAFEVKSRAHLLEITGIHEIVIRASLFSDMLKYLDQSPSVEEGGLLMGFLKPVEGHHDDSGQFIAQPKQYSIVITDHIPSGPAARRTRGSLHSDLEFQEYVFREIEKREQRIMHLGSWHSHHCNSYNSLSNGDIESYLAMVNSPRHAHSYYFAILFTDKPERVPSRYTTDSPELEDLMKCLRFYLIMRGHDKLYSLDPECIHLQDGIEDFSAFIEDLAKQAYSSHFEHAHGKVKRTTHGQMMATSLPERERRWQDLESSKQVLGNDTRFFDNLLPLFPGLSKRDRLQNGQLERVFSARNLEIVYRYPLESSDEGIAMEACRVDNATVGAGLNHSLIKAHVMLIPYARFILKALVETVLAATISIQ